MFFGMFSPFYVIFPLIIFSWSLGLPPDSFVEFHARPTEISPTHSECRRKPTGRMRDRFFAATAVMSQESSSWLSG